MKAIVFCLLLTAPCLLGGHWADAAGRPETGRREIRVLDFRGKPVCLEKPATRIVCLIESALSGLYMLGAGERVVGVSTSACAEGTGEYYRRLDARICGPGLPTPGNWDFINLEKVIALRPDLVIIWAHQEEAIRAIEERGIPVFGVFLRGLEEVYDEMLALGELTGCRDRAVSLIEYTKRELAGVKETISTVKDRPGVYFMWAQGDLETSGRPSTVDELIRLAGGVNVAGSIELEHVVINREKLLAWDPRVVIMWPNPRKGPKDFIGDPVWENISAVKNSRVFQLPDIFSCDLWTLKFQFAVKLIARQLYPELFAGMEPEAERTKIFDELYRIRF